MPKINVYLPDDLADAVRQSGLPVSPICQRALEQALRRMTTIRQEVLTDLDPASMSDRLPGFTARLITVLTTAADRAQNSEESTPDRSGTPGSPALTTDDPAGTPENPAPTPNDRAGTPPGRTTTAGSPAVTTGDLLYGLLTERQNLGCQVLAAMEIAPDSLTAPGTAEPKAPERTAAEATIGTGSRRFSGPAAAALESAVGEAIGLGHNYVGCEHLLIGLAAEPDGAAGRLLRERGADGRTTRRAVAAALAGYAHLRSTGSATASTGLLTAIRNELAPLVERIERLESSRPA